MKRQEILDKLAAHRDELRSSGVKSVSLFGSAARDEATDTSDVDLLVAFDRPTGLFALIRLKHRREEMLQIDSVDLLTRDGLHPALKDQILEEAIDVVV
jgi:predicted nucleotidyltransferase